MTSGVNERLGAIVVLFVEELLNDGNVEVGNLLAPGPRFDFRLNGRFQCVTPAQALKEWRNLVPGKVVVRPENLHQASENTVTADLIARHVKTAPVWGDVRIQAAFGFSGGKLESFAGWLEDETQNPLWSHSRKDGWAATQDELEAVAYEFVTAMAAPGGTEKLEHLAQWKAAERLEQRGREFTSMVHGRPFTLERRGFPSETSVWFLLCFPQEPDGQFRCVVTIDDGYVSDFLYEEYVKPVVEPPRRQLPTACPVCGEPPEPDWRFCMLCGHPYE